MQQICKISRILNNCVLKASWEKKVICKQALFILLLNLYSSLVRFNAFPLSKQRMLVLTIHSLLPTTEGDNEILVRCTMRTRPRLVSL